MTPEEAKELLVILWLVRDAIMASPGVVSTKAGMARMLYLRDEDTEKFVAVLKNGIETLARIAGEKP